MDTGFIIALGLFWFIITLLCLNLLRDSYSKSLKDRWFWIIFVLDFLPLVFTPYYIYTTESDPMSALTNRDPTTFFGVSCLFYIIERYRRIDEEAREQEQLEFFNSPAEVERRQRLEAIQEARAQLRKKKEDKVKKLADQIYEKKIK